MKIALLDPAEDVLNRITVLLWCIVLGLVIAFCYFASAFCITLVLAGFLSIVVDPVITYLERWRLPRGFTASLLIIAGMVLLAWGCASLLTPVSEVADNLPYYADQIRDKVEPLVRNIAKMQETAGKLDGSASNPTGKNSRTVREVRLQEPGWGSYLVRGFGSVTSALMILGVVPFLMLFFLIRKEKWYNTVADLVGPTHNPRQFSNQLVSMVRRFFVGNLAVGALLAAPTITLLLLLHINNAVLLGFISGALNVVPFLGAILGALVPMCAAVLQFSSLGAIVSIGLTVVVLHVLVSYFLIPRFIGPRVDVGPVAATAGILFWGWLWGLMGVLLAVPLTGAVKIIADSNPNPTLSRLSELLGASSAGSPNSPPAAHAVISTSTTPGH